VERRITIESNSIINVPIFIVFVPYWVEENQKLPEESFPRDFKQHAYGNETIQNLINFSVRTISLDLIVMKYKPFWKGERSIWWVGPIILLL